MTTAIPHSAVIKKQLNEYLEDAIETLEESFGDVPAMPEFRTIYKNCVGTFTPLTKIARGRLPLLKTTAGVVKRAPLLIASRQVQLAYIELRRLIEVINCYPYYAEHPIEWSSFAESPGEGYVKDQEKPIYWSAHRELRWYSNYIKERFQIDKSGLVARSVDDNVKCYSEFSGHVHAALDYLTKKPLTNVFDPIDSPTLKKFSDAQKRVYRATLILAIAPHPKVVGKLNAIERAWFDWVLGKDRQMKIRAGDFLSE